MPMQDSMSELNEPTILVTGASGQVGFELVRSLQGLGRVIAPGREMLDLADGNRLASVVRDIKPSLIINPAAYTAVDQAEADVDAAMCVNAVAPGILALEARRLGIPLIHYSTDYVFDGMKDGPYDEDDCVGPLNMYGKSKLAGERAIEEACGMYLVIRTSWVYGARGRNFLRTMLRLVEERTELRIVADQVGAPTWSRTIAASTTHIIAQAMAVPDDARADWWASRSGIYHLTAGEHASWAQFAEAIFDLAAPTRRPNVVPIGSEEYPTPARRPLNSRLSCAKLAATFGIHPPHWRAALALCLGERE
jgi:dTDP-4-dehydrorhamnose reductase